ncbi:hypothetical protein LPMP_291930 [Leishmania panamensis]|uniref:Uncharacterized protein n=1 Tax=Leishmania panamensis TaxID=5679 RepID=A0A088RW82_LEIPA|nr:hypothetical protein LPMP_291930 [Leishmania panamensis]AIO00141.1 hypothetical protein LPMP_291930 [Leishmania panamensis]
MNSTAVARASPDIQSLHISYQDVRLEVEMLHQPHFTVEATQPWSCEEASLSLTRAVTLHRPEEQARQRRIPLGAYKAGTVHIIAEGQPSGPAAYDTSVASDGMRHSTDAAVLSIPLYVAHASYRRPNLYKEHLSLCIVEGTQHPSTLSRPQRRGGGRRHSHSGVLEGRAHKLTRVLFIDIAALTPDPRASLRCTSTGEISAPAALYFRWAPASSSSSTSASTKDSHRLQGRHPPGHGARDGSQQRHRRVVLLPPTAAGKTFELVSISVKRGLGE